MIKSDHEASIIDVKNALMRELRRVEGFKVMPEKPQAGCECCHRSGGKERLGGAEHCEVSHCIR